MRHPASHFSKIAIALIELVRSFKRYRLFDSYRDCATIAPILEVAPRTRGALTLAGLAVLLLGFRWWYPDHFRWFFSCVVAFYVLLYIAGGGRLPWKIKFRDYFAYVAISPWNRGACSVDRVLRGSQNSITSTTMVNDFVHLELLQYGPIQTHCRQIGPHPRSTNCCVTSITQTLMPHYSSEHSVE